MGNTCTVYQYHKLCEDLQVWEIHVQCISIINFVVKSLQVWKIHVQCISIINFVVKTNYRYGKCSKILTLVVARPYSTICRELDY